MDLPTPGSPATQHHGAGHEAAAEHAVELADPGAAGLGAARVDVADRDGGPVDDRSAAVVRTATAPISLTVPQAWHSPHRPTHLIVVQPHSEQR